MMVRFLPSSSRIGGPHAVTARGIGVRCTAMSRSRAPFAMRSPSPIHPGELLLDDFLLPRGLSQRAFAARLGWAPRRLNELVTGQRGITPESAAELSRALGTSLELWLHLQVRWVLHAAREKRAPASRLGWLAPSRRVPPPRRRPASDAGGKLGRAGSG